MTPDGREIVVQRLTADLPVRAGHLAPLDVEMNRQSVLRVLTALEACDYQIIEPADQRYDSADMWEAWSAGARWICDRVEIYEGELLIPEDQPGFEGTDWREACGDWLGGFDMERDCKETDQ